MFVTAALAFVLASGCRSTCNTLDSVKLSSPHVRVWRSPEANRSLGYHGMLVLWPMPNSNMFGDAKILMLIGNDLDLDVSMRGIVQTVVDVIPVNTYATAVTWTDFDGIGGKDDFIVATQRGATGYRNVYVGIRESEQNLAIYLQEGSRYLPYVGDGDNDGKAEIYLSTASHEVDDQNNIHPTEYRVLTYIANDGFVETQRIATNDLPIENLIPLRDDSYTDAEIVEAINSTR